MAAPRGRQTKGTFVQSRLTDREKRILQAYADAKGITLSDLIRKCLSELIKVITPPPSGKD